MCYQLEKFYADGLDGGGINVMVKGVDDRIELFKAERIGLCAVSRLGHRCLLAHEVWTSAMHFFVWVGLELRSCKAQILFNLLPLHPGSVLGGILDHGLVESARLPQLTALVVKFMRAH